MILCQCTGVTDTTICQLIEAGAASVAEITRRCGAGRCCAPCRKEIAAMLYRTCDSSHTGHAEALDQQAGCGSP
ncbi:MAG: BFD-like [2Fe-2S] binding domain [Deltaproteobacteria bacterium]|jgi:bacterioferritin-associated ferredoxin|nr:BFD-like [2Fe-2S] binding domain [Deltaproteobacteria bacterium]